MSRTKNYAAFYVAEPFSPCNLAAYATHDFCFYNQLKAWKGLDSTFPFYDAHESTYSVRDGSDWETTLKPRLRKRLRNSKNIILFLSDKTRNSRALKEEIEYGVGELGLPLIIVYPDYRTGDSLLRQDSIKNEIRSLWNKIPRLRDLIMTVPSIHIPYSKEHIKAALNDPDFTVQGKFRIKDQPYFYH